MNTYHINVYKGDDVDEYIVEATSPKEAIETAMRYYYEANPRHGANKIEIHREPAMA